MADTSPSFKKSDYLLMVSLLALFLFLLLYQFRQFDDNRLTSWKWVFDGVDVSGLFFFIVTGIIAAYPLSRTSLYERRPVALLLFSSFLISIFFYSEPEVIVDASRYFTQAKHLEVYGLKYFLEEWGRDINAWTDLPLLPFIYGLIFKFFGEARLFIQLFNSLLFSMTLLLTYKIGSTLWDEDTGITAGALLLGIPYLFTQVPLMLVDVPAMFLLSLSVLTFLMALERGGIWPLISASSLSLSFYAKYSMWLMLSVLGIIFLVYCIQGAVKRDKVIKRGVIVAAAAGILIGSVFWYKYDLFSVQMSFLQEFQKPGLKRWGESLLSTFFFQVHPFISISALFSVYVAFRKRDMKYLIISWLLILLLVLQIKRARYMIPAFPMLALMASYGLQWIKDREVKRFVVLCAVLTSIIISIFFYLPFLQGMSAVNFKDAGRYLDDINASNIEIMTLPSKTFNINPAVSVPILDLFTEKDISYRYTNPSSLPEKTKKSSLRFTWDYKNPEYYEPDLKAALTEGAPLVIISNERVEALPESIIKRVNSYPPPAIFDTSTDYFRYSPVVIVYQPY